MAVAKKQQEPDLRDQLLADYDRLEDAIENVATPELWELADWLAEYVPEQKRGPKGITDPGVGISISDLAGRRDRSERWLQRLRKIAKQTAPNRLDEVSPSTYIDLLQKHGGDLEKANAALQDDGTKRRDHRSGEGTQAIIKALRQKSDKDKAQVARALYRDIGPVELEPDEDEEIIEDEEPIDEAPEPNQPTDDRSVTLNPSYVYCNTQTVGDVIDGIENLTIQLFELDRYKIGKRDRTRARKVYQKGIDALEAIDG